MANWRSKNALPQRSWLNWGTVDPLDEDRANLQASFMIKSELIQRISSQNPHLFQRDIEKIVNAIFDEMVEALTRGDRVEPSKHMGSAATRLCAGSPRAASGQATTVPPKSVMNSRRFIRSPRRREQAAFRHASFRIMRENASAMMTLAQR